MTKVTIRSRDKGMRRIVRDLQAADGTKHVAVGIRQGDGAEDRVQTVGPPGARRSVTGTSEDPTLAEVAFKNEFGVGIPERPFMRQAFDKNKESYAKISAKGIRRVVDGKDSLDTVLETIGLRVKDDVQLSITELRTPPNSAATKEAKGSDNPLIDTGRMRQAIGSELRDGAP